MSSILLNNTKVSKKKSIPNSVLGFLPTLIFSLPPAWHTGKPSASTQHRWHGESSSYLPTHFFNDRQTVWGALITSPTWSWIQISTLIMSLRQFSTVRHTQLRRHGVRFTHLPHISTLNYCQPMWVAFNTSPTRSWLHINIRRSVRPIPIRMIHQVTKFPITSSARYRGAPAINVQTTCRMPEQAHLRCCFT